MPIGKKGMEMVKIPFVDDEKFPLDDIFYIDRYEVSNASFEKFVLETGYVTEAEMPIDSAEILAQLPKGTEWQADWSFAPGSLVFQPTSGPVSYADPSVWWQWVDGAHWKNIDGTGQWNEEYLDHPVVHVSWNDAKAYCQWAGKRLPTEKEWEWVASGGKMNFIYPWGNELKKDNQFMSNYYQGLFPFENTEKDGYKNTAPIGSFPPNVFGVYDLAGNVWEWCSDSLGMYERVVRGGSFLCDMNYCSSYRVTGRMENTKDSALNHTGFRCVCDSIE